MVFLETPILNLLFGMGDLVVVVVIYFYFITLFILFYF